MASTSTSYSFRHTTMHAHSNTNWKTESVSGRKKLPLELTPSLTVPEESPYHVDPEATILKAQYRISLAFLTFRPSTS